MFAACSSYAIVRVSPPPPSGLFRRTQIEERTMAQLIAKLFLYNIRPVWKAGRECLKQLHHTSRQTV